MNIDIRQAVYNNVKNSSESEFRDIIEDAITNGEEKMLPGLGALFERLWSSLDDNAKQDMLQKLTTAHQ